MKFWQKLAQIFSGILNGYLIAQGMKLITILSGFLLLAQNLSGGAGSNSFLSSIAAWGLLLVGMVFALAVGVISNFLLIAFVPISGVVSSFTSAAIVLWYVLPIATSVVLSLFG